MAGSIFGNLFRVSTFGESHGVALGCVIDGCPAGLELSMEDIQIYLDRRKPGKTAISTQRKEADEVEILSGIFEGKTTGTPIALVVRNTSQHSADYSEIATCYRPGHADYTFDQKFGFRDYRGGGRSSGRETIGRVASGAIAAKLLSHYGIDICAYSKSIGPVSINMENFDRNLITSTPTAMPDKEANEKAIEYLDTCRNQLDSAGGVIECRIKNVPAGLGSPVFDKLDAKLAEAMMSIGAVKAVEIGDGIAVANAKGSTNNDAFVMEQGKVSTKTNHAGGILGGISNGQEIIFRVYVKPTPSIYQEQETITVDGQEKKLQIKGRHDPIIVPRAVVVVECMAALVLTDALLSQACSRMDYLDKIFK